MNTELRNPDAASRIGRTNDEMSVDLGGAIRRRYLRARVAVPLNAIDRLLDDLEVLNLAGRRRVPFEWETRLARLVAMLPAEVHLVPDLRSNISTTRLMDRLYELQDILLDLKVGPARSALREFDAGEPGLCEEPGAEESRLDVA